MEITYLKTIENGYILDVQTLDKKYVPPKIEDENELHSEVIDTKEEYDNLLVVFKSSPQVEEGFEYRLKTDLTWDRVEIIINS